MIAAKFIDANTVIVPHNRREVADYNQIISRRFALAHIRDDAVVGVAVVDPLKPAVVKINLIQRRITLIHQVQIADAILHSLIHRMFQQEPAQSFFRIPLPVMAELAAHEEQLFAGVRVHKAIVGAQVGKLLPLVAGHFGKH